jgi:hypothetical protein
MQTTDQLATNFLKSAGLFEAPPNMVKDLTQLVLYIFASVVLFNIDGRELTTVGDELILRKLKQKAKQYSNRVMSTHDYIRKFPLDLTNWKYLNKEREQLLKQWINEGLIDNYINVKIIFKKQKNAGLYDKNTNTMTVYIKNANMNSVEEFDYAVFDIIQTVRHEVQHFAQFLLSDLLRKKYIKRSPKDQSKGDLAGLPGKKLRSEDYDYDGTYLRNNYPSNNVANHALRDMEFYTNLEDAINIFKRHIAYIPQHLKKSFMYAFIDMPNNFIADQKKVIYKKKLNSEETLKEINYYYDIGQPFFAFKILHNEDIGKWKKAVSIFYTKINSLL